MDDCENCIYFLLESVLCTTDRGDQILYEPSCKLDKCVKEENKNE
ncbi:hypothetical protein [Clostridium niameyense]|nr:hypothetical protein [Clostridium niameyense]